MKHFLQSAHFKKYAKRIIFFFLGLIGLVLIASGGLAFYFSHNKTEIASKINNKINDNISGAIHIGDIQYKFLTGFPNLTLALKDVNLKDSLWAEHKRTFLVAKEIEVRLNIMSLLSDKIDFHKIEINDATLDLYNGPNGITNTDIFRKKTKKEKNMKLIRFGEEGKEKPGVLLNDKRYDVSSIVTTDYNEAFFENDGLAKLEEALKNNPSLPEVSDSVRLGSPVARPSKIICIGLNYVDHCEETGAAIPEEPIIFFKSTTSLCGPNDNLIIPKNSKKTDWEVELAIVIGKKASYVDEQDALEHVAGYVLHNDYSERAFQLERNGQWVKGKSCDTFAPLGPFIATPDEIEDVHNLRLWLKVNGEILQDGNTSNLIFNIPFVVSYISQFMTLLPGDVITTGTPAGVGLGQKPEPWYLKEGDVVELGIDGLGSSKQHVKSYQA